MNQPPNQPKDPLLGNLGEWTLIMQLRTRAEKAEAELERVKANLDAVSERELHAIATVGEIQEELERVKRQNAAMREALQDSNTLLRSPSILDETGQVAAQISDNNDALTHARAIGLVKEDNV
jgi:hypothetical protein